MFGRTRSDAKRPNNSAHGGVDHRRLEPVYRNGPRHSGPGKHGPHVDSRIGGRASPKYVSPTVTMQTAVNMSPGKSSTNGQSIAVFIQNQLKAFNCDTANPETFDILWLTIEGIRTNCDGIDRKEKISFTRHVWIDCGSQVGPNENAARLDNVNLAPATYESVDKGTGFATKIEISIPIMKKTPTFNFMKNMIRLLLLNCSKTMNLVLTMRETTTLVSLWMAPQPTEETSNDLKQYVMMTMYQLIHAMITRYPPTIPGHESDPNQDPDEFTDSQDVWKLCTFPLEFSTLTSFDRDAFEYHKNYNDALKDRTIIIDDSDDRKLTE